MGNEYYERRAVEATALFGVEFEAMGDGCEYHADKGATIRIHGGNLVPLEGEVMDAGKVVASCKGQASVRGVYDSIGERAGELIAKYREAKEEAERAEKEAKAKATAKRASKPKAKTGE